MGIVSDNPCDYALHPPSGEGQKHQERGRGNLFLSVPEPFLGQEVDGPESNIDFNVGSLIGCKHTDVYHF